jgi:hypothetical protein
MVKNNYIDNVSETDSNIPLGFVSSDPTKTWFKNVKPMEIYDYEPIM